MGCGEENGTGQPPVEKSAPRCCQGGKQEHHSEEKTDAAELRPWLVAILFVRGDVDQASFTDLARKRQHIEKLGLVCGRWWDRSCFDYRCA